MTTEEVKKKIAEGDFDAIFHITPTDDGKMQVDYTETYTGVPLITFDEPCSNFVIWRDGDSIVLGFDKYYEGLVYQILDECIEGRLHERDK